MKPLLIILVAINIVAIANEYNDAVSNTEFLKRKNKQSEEFNNYKSGLEKEYKEYKLELEKEYKNYQKELKTYWKEPKLSTKKEWVSYTKDKKSRSKVDFEKNKYTVEVIASNIDEAKKRFKERISYVVGKNTKEVMKSDPLQKKILKISKHNTKVANSPVKAKAILSSVIFKTKPTKKTVQKYTDKIIKNNKITTKKSKLSNKLVYKMSVDLPKNSKIKLSKNYLHDVLENSKRFRLPHELIFAIIQTESDFNPFAKSYVPAFGLMQIVPSTAGRDTYKMLFKKDKEPSAVYLYNGQNNIEMGSAYLNILYYRYLKKIKNPVSRLYCTIAGYNTGAGNIAWAFTHKYNMNNAAPIINKLTPEEVYFRLQNDLRYDEPKHYLKRVKRRMKIYKQVYQDI
jgi:membrane-bound lytic murein transglycosylase C